MLQCIISALKAEAEPLADYYGLKQDHSYDYPSYGTDEMKIIVQIDEKILMMS